MPSYYKLHLGHTAKRQVFGATAPHLISSLSLQGARVSLTHPALPQVTVLGRLLLYSLVTCPSCLETKVGIDEAKRIKLDKSRLNRPHTRELCFSTIDNRCQSA